MDRLSELPEFLLHQILSYLPTKEAARTSVLSKTWLQSYSTSSVLDFNEWYFCKSTEIEENRHPFFNFVNNTLLRYTTLNLRIHKFRIKVFGVDHAPAYHLLDKSLGVAFNNGVEYLDISVVAPIEFSPYTLPETIFHSPKLLTSLEVEQCKFPQHDATIFQFRNPIIFPFLKTLNLTLAYVDDGMLQKLLSGSPLLEEIVFFRVSGFKQFRVANNLGQLKLIEIESTCKPIDIDIEDAPRLCLLKYRGSFKMPCLLKVGSGSAENLKNLELDTVSISDSFLMELITKFPCLEELKIETCDGLERISIVSDSLKHLKFVCCKNLVEAKTDARKLLDLGYEYIGKNVLSLSLYNTPKELMTEIYITYYYGRRYNLWRPSNAWFHQLRELLKSLTQARVSFRMLCHERFQCRAALDNRANPLPLEYQSMNFMPEMNPSSLFSVFVDTLFSSSRPTAITCPIVRANGYFIEFLGSELITATRNPNCCSCDQTECWRNYLNDIKVEVGKEDQEVWQPLHLEIPPSEFKFLDKDHIRFKLNCDS